MNPLKRLVRRWVPERYRGNLYRVFYFARRASSVLFTGQRFFCPCCGGGFRRMRSWDGIPDIRCPRCGSLERQRLLMLYFHRKTELFTKDHRLLHLAPEPSLQRVLGRLPGLQYVTGDLNLPLADLKLDATDMPFEDGEFDVVLCLHVLEHIPDDRKAMSELHRILKPGGWGIFQVPIDLDRQKTLEDPTVTSPADRLRLYGQEDHVRFYGADYIDRLREAGFDVDVDGFVREVSESVQRGCALKPDEDIIVGRKLGGAP